jgi:hypothetical protein
MWIELINFFEMEAVGVEFGFGEKDELATGCTRRSLRLPATRRTLRRSPPSATRSRPWPCSRARAPATPTVRGTWIRHDREEALKHAAESQRIFEFGGPNIMASGNNLAFSDYLVGKKFKVKLDGKSTPPPLGSAAGNPSMSTMS